MPQTIRAFIAIDLPSFIKEAIARLQSELKNTKSDVKWVKPANCHITLKFLGDVGEDQLEAIYGSLKKCGSAPFQLTVESMGAFPSMQKPNIIWVGLNDKSRNLAKLAAGVEEECAALGFAKENRSFVPHITIGRTRPGSHKALAEALQNLPAPSNLTFEAESITVFQSVLSSEGSTYSILKELLF